MPDEKLAQTTPGTWALGQVHWGSLKSSATTPSRSVQTYAIFSSDGIGRLIWAVDL